VSALDDIAAERRRQIEEEGWDAAHDDEHVDNSLARAAACYAMSGTRVLGTESALLNIWPWASNWWKPKDRRRDLVRAAALLVAEIERIDRAAAAKP
jgi:hypothetical protein